MRVWPAHLRALVPVPRMADRGSAVGPKSGAIPTIEPTSYSIRLAIRVLAADSSNVFGLVMKGGLKSTFAGIPTGVLPTLPGGVMHRAGGQGRGVAGLLMTPRARAHFPNDIVAVPGWPGASTGPKALSSAQAVSAESRSDGDSSGSQGRAGQRCPSTMRYHIAG